MTRGVFAAAVALIVIGIFESVLHPTAATVTADVVPADKLRQHFALNRVMSNAGRVVGPALGAVLVLWSLGLVFFGAALSLLLGALCVAVFLPETLTRRAAAGDDDDDEGLTALGAAFRDRRLAALLIPVAVLEISASWIEAIMPLYASNAGTISPSGIGLLFSYAGMIIVIFQLPIIHASAKMKGFSIVVASGLALAFAFGSLLASPGLPLLIAAVTLLSLAQMLFVPLVQTIAAKLAPANARATYMAAFSTVGDLKDTAGPAIGTYLYALSVSLPWLVGIPVVLGAAGVLAFVARRHEASQ
jgi:DHA1 family tetracycline resistance protein-like MFS transporter